MNQPLYLIAGLGKTGHSIAGYLRRRNLPFVVFDTRKEVKGLAEFAAEFPGVDVFLGELPNTIYQQLTAIITSPGISLDEVFLQEAFRRNIPVLGDIECLAREIHAPVIAITGTNGKSTVTTLVGEMAKIAGLSVAVAGNIGLPVLDLLDNEYDYDLWVLELSSFQLDLTYSLRPVAATVLNVSPDHLDRHHTYGAYIDSKQRIYQNAQFLLYNRQDEHTYPKVELTHAKRADYGLDKPTASNWGIVEKNGIHYLAQGEHCFLAVDDLRIKGKHNWQNALAACALARAAGIDFEPIIHVLRSFKGLPHRCQWVRTLNQVDWINDSKGTNIGATISAISGIGGSMQGKIVLIAGGQGKGADFAELRTPVADYVRSVVLIGEDADKIETALSDIVPILRAPSLDGAVMLAKEQAKPGDVVLLSPACASLDMFRDFNHRGEVFTDLVGKL
ncbi:UDP-N-acetylmuramoyl-L-alanine--D-glutamate ligase [Legionella hackeliae]|uniref:UDP-N-acetylmuramoylalanine--D-glutamate ligase n=1 Tax=Legionella hackeliae TaxID=449 RepID=A0A0A8UYQ2_LEGHA|nr:UDP-N-acetylmuramoyl-L-alanine--D-glutamate ligase [Legionella hackeliae]KTD12486.1 UDP-N-acetylmuramoylalanine--D-glutamate ligase [Legionella hackeliae]CEK11899.1 UDP-N-acetylmuramoylalanine--D-glutamate ligase [Legionella hackeliae]STX48669.1 UDP-N-acetylmuramoylalanine--D-glutamate ligase [Legionella hackeliae]